MQDISKEIVFQTARSGGKGGQHVNKVETAVTGFWHIDNSSLFSEAQKATLLVKLANQVNAEGQLYVKSQVHRSQLGNKDEVVRKMNQLVTKALQKKKARIATRPGKNAKEKRITAKKRHAEVKASRKSVKPGNF